MPEYQTYLIQFDPFHRLVFSRFFIFAEISEMLKKNLSSRVLTEEIRLF